VKRTSHLERNEFVAVETDVLVEEKKFEEKKVIET
tara:strand:+ start:1024 stop:1128 length:105 start_codon:yes stop_codon:yes gene_type:complete